MLSRPASRDLEDIANFYMKLFKLIGSPAFPVPEAEMRERILMGLRRSYMPQGSARQTMAIVADSTRAEELRGLKVPTLVIHGKADRLVPFANGEDTARRIAGAKLVAIEGMGHDLPPGVVERLLSPLLAHMKVHRFAAPAA